MLPEKVRFPRHPIVQQLLFRWRVGRQLLTALFSSSSLLLFPPSYAATNNYCQLSAPEVEEKANLFQTALKGNSQAQKDYNGLVRKHAELLQRCRAQNWPATQAIWLRLYPCDVRPGSLEGILDRIVNKGYNTVYLEVFSDSQVLLPPADNPTVWDSVIRTPQHQNLDLLAQTIKKGHERGLKVYAWLFSLNFGYVYAQKDYRQSVLARNSKGEDSTKFVHDQSQAFVDPYHPQAQQDYYQLLKAVLQRRPDGVLFDYIRYPRGTGTQSAVGEVKDLWIYGEASRQALYDRALNPKGRFLLEKYVSQGYITLQDVQEADRLYPKVSPQWQGRFIPPKEMEEPAAVRWERWKSELWYLAVAHAAQGVINFLAWAGGTVQQGGIPAGAVFFPDGNQIVGGKGFDSRLQAWDQFPPSLEWHPMAYALCQEASCVAEQVKRVVTMAPAAQYGIIPAIAGQWGRSYGDRPSLEEQMQAIRAFAPKIKGVSHFAFSWQEPEFDKERRFCQL